MLHKPKFRKGGQIFSGAFFNIIAFLLPNIFGKPQRGVGHPGGSTFKRRRLRLSKRRRDPPTHQIIHKYESLCNKFVNKGEDRCLHSLQSSKFCKRSLCMPVILKKIIFKI